jgi:hypothetical protein|tara:strand:- start:382 stop:627 length:246 start_codon:yes stop_codon:yes gene_type:complete
MKISNLFENKKLVDSKTFMSLPPLHKEAVTDFFKVVEKEDGKNIVMNVEEAVDKVAEFHDINTAVIYDYIEAETDEQLGEK